MRLHAITRAFFPIAILALTNARPSTAALFCDKFKSQLEPAWQIINNTNGWTVNNGLHIWNSPGRGIPTSLFQNHFTIPVSGDFEATTQVFMSRHNVNDMPSVGIVLSQAPTDYLYFSL